MRLSSAGRLASAGMSALLFAAPASSQDVSSGHLRLVGAWARPTPPGAPAGAGYVTIINDGKQSDRLLGGSSALVKRIELHEMKIKNGVMRMRPIRGGLPIPPGKSLDLAPGGFHIMLIGPRQRLVAGQALPVTLRFERAGNVKVNLRIRMAPPEPEQSE